MVAQARRAPAAPPRRRRPRGGALPRVRLRDLPPALVGHADPDRLLRAVRHGARAARSACRCCCRWTSARPAPATRWRSSRSSCRPHARACDGPARRETDTLDCHFDALWLWIPACVPRGGARGLARGDPRAARPAPLAALRAPGRWLGQRQLRVRPADRHQGAARHRAAGVPHRRRAVRRLPVSRDGHPRRAQDEQASRQRRRPRRAGGALRRRHRAAGGPLCSPPAEVAELERLGGAALPQVPRAGVGVLARDAQAAGGR